MSKDNDPKLADVLEKIKDPETKTQFFDKIKLLPLKHIKQKRPSAGITHE